MMEPLDKNVSVPAGRTWLERHVVVVIVMLLGVIGLTVVLCCGGLVALVFHLTSNSPVYTLAMRRLNEEPGIMRRMGEPIEPGWLMSSSISIHDDKGEARMRIPLKGKKEKAEVFIKAIRRGGQWKLTYLAVQFETDPPGKPVVIVGKSDE